MIEWKATPKYDATETFRRTTHESRDGRFRIEHLRSLFGLPDRVLGIVDGRIVIRGRKVTAVKHRLQGLARSMPELSIEQSDD